jgi:carboxypeptidase Q
MNRRSALSLCIFGFILGAFGPAAAQTSDRAEPVDLSVIPLIKAEAFGNSQVMDQLFYLSDVYGPRLTNSPGFFHAAEWATKRMQDLGLSNVHKETWGPYGRGWACKHFSAHLLTPQYAPLIGVPLAYTNSTNGVVRGDAVMATISSENDFAKYRGKLRGKIVLTEPLRPIPEETRPITRRFTDAELQELARADVPSPDFEVRPDRATKAAMARFRDELRQFWREEGVLVLLNPGYKDGTDGTVFAKASGTAQISAPIAPPTVALAWEQYNRIARLVQHGLAPQLEFDIRNEFYDSPGDTFNVIAELPGTRKKDEVVMIGAHLDSWQGGTGATDNAAGCAVMMDVMRVLKTLQLKMDRTVRIALWSAEEVDELGSKAYVAQHFAESKAEHDKLAAYFNFDDGAGKIRGIYLQGNDTARPIFETWLAPFHDEGADTVTIRFENGSDDVNFNRLGLPAFGFIQDPLDYETVTHHSNMDLYDHVPSADLEQAVAIISSLVYNAANRQDKLPGAPMPAR